MEAGTARGTVTSLSSSFPVEDAHKAAKRVEEALDEKRKELDRLRGFISDNIGLINLVQKLPEELHHDVMVPFGKAAFFPGRLIHTNELLVFLGEGYYAERTSKQTVDILKRRGKALESQADSVKAMMEDLKAEASFFDATAFEAAEGLVEIREDYEDEKPPERESEPGLSNREVHNTDGIVEDEEYARIMSRLDELEEEELAAGSDYESDEDKEKKTLSGNLSDQEFVDENSSSSEIETIQPRELMGPEKDGSRGAEESLNQLYRQQDLTCSGLTVESLPRVGMSHGKSLEDNVTKYNFPKKAGMFPPGSKATQPAPSTSSRSEVPDRSSEPAFDRQKAFTGSIIERTDNLPKNSEDPMAQPSESQPAKRVSRFKMQRR